MLEIGRTIPQAVTFRRPGFEPRLDHVGSVVDKVALGLVFSEYFSFPGNSHSTDCSTFVIIYHPGLVQ
jgi:hypothetical protein